MQPPRAGKGTWLAMHGKTGRQGRSKNAYANRERAEAHAAELNEVYPDSDTTYRAYSCHWTDNPDAGQIAPMHWHVGRIKK